MKTINIGIIGFGTVGSGVVKILKKNRELIRERTGLRINLKKIADVDLSKRPGITVKRSLLTRDYRKIISDPNIDIIVELIGGCRVAKDVVIRSLKNGKAVVTANKALLAEHGKEVFFQAERYGGDIYYEASVAGSTPIIKLLREGLVANKINSMLGIVNGTSNYILTKMSREGKNFKEALCEAKTEGYAEANPRLDIEGIDSAHKLAILSSLAMGKWIDANKVYTEGITRITHEDILYAARFGYVIKLLAITKEKKGEIEVRVHPTLLSRKHQLSLVGGVYNAIFVKGDNVGNALYYGKGAGQLPAASAVVADIVDVARNLSHGIKHRVPAIRYSKQKKRIKPMEQIVCKNYLRFNVLDRPGVLAKIAGILGRHKISIESVLQVGRHRVSSVPVVIMTHKALEKNVRKALAETDRLPQVRAATVRVRVEE